MSIERNKTLVRRLIEKGIGEADLDTTRDLLSKAAVSGKKNPSSSMLARLANDSIFAQRRALQEFKVTVNALVAERDTVVVFWQFEGLHRERFQGVPPTGRKIGARLVSVVRCRDGKIESFETAQDRLSIHLQLGSLGDHLPAVFGDATLDVIPPLQKGTRVRNDKAARDAAERRITDGYAERSADALVARLRYLMDHFRSNQPANFDDVDVIKGDVGGIPVEWVVAEGGSQRHRIVHCHGGGWVSGGILSARSRAIALARAAKGCVLIFDYRLAPEHRFPAGLEDCCKMLEWAAANRPDGPAPEQETATITLSGDSAGASLAVAACVHAIARQTRKPDYLALLCPQLSVVPHSERVARSDLLATQDTLWYIYNVYTGGRVSATDPRVSPLYTPIETLAQFPPTLLQVSGDELFLWDAKKFADRLIAADVRCALSVWPGMIHGWHSLLEETPEAAAALAEVANFLQPLTG